MAVFSTTDTEEEVIEKVRATYRAYMPELDAWQKPSYHDVNSIVVGGIAWSAMNEARNGIDARVNPSTAVGSALDLIAASPPLFLTRNNPTPSTGYIFVSCDDTATVSAFAPGYVFSTADGVEFTVTDTTALDANGEALVPVQSVLEGSENNSCEGQPMDAPDGCAAVSRGVFGGFDRECDAQLRRRIFAARSKCFPLGSPQWYEAQILGAIDGITRTWLVSDGGMAKIFFLMEDKYPCGSPEQEDVDALNAYFEDECKIGLCFCPIFVPAKTAIISPEICWETPPEDINDVIDGMVDWLRANYEIGQSVHTNQIQCFLDSAFPQYGGTIKCCEEFTVDCETALTCVEILGPC